MAIPLVNGPYRSPPFVDRDLDLRGHIAAFANEKPFHSDCLFVFDEPEDREKFYGRLIDEKVMDRIFDGNFGRADAGWMHTQGIPDSSILIELLLEFEKGRQFLIDKIEFYHRGEARGERFYEDLYQAVSESDGEGSLIVDDLAEMAIESVDDPSLDRLRFAAALAAPPKVPSLFAFDCGLSDEIKEGLTRIVPDRHYPHGTRQEEIDASFACNLLHWVLFAAAQTGRPLDAYIERLAPNELLSLSKEFLEDSNERLKPEMKWLLDRCLWGLNPDSLNIVLILMPMRLTQAYFRSIIGQVFLENIEHMRVCPSLGKGDHSVARLERALQKLATLEILSPGLFGGEFVRAIGIRDRPHCIKAMALAAEGSEGSLLSLACIIDLLSEDELSSLLEDQQFIQVMKRAPFFEALSDLYFNYSLDPAMKMRERRHKYISLLNRFPADFKEEFCKYLRVTNQRLWVPKHLFR